MKQIGCYAIGRSLEVHQCATSEYEGCCGGGEGGTHEDPVGTELNDIKEFF